MAEKTINFIKLPDGETYRVGGGSGFNLFDTKISDHILEGEEALGWALQGTYVYKEGVAGSRIGYADFYNRCLEEKELGTATETTLGDNTITMYINANGHNFYNIADKDVVDTWYNTYGIADYYGIDLVNERIFLPRDKYFAVTGGVMGNGMTLGLIDGSATNNFGLAQSSTDVYGLYGTTSVYGANVGTSASGGTQLLGQNGVGITTDSTKSGITLEPNENKYLYYCVGNTKVESAITNVTEITTSENDTLPLFHNFYSKEDMTTTGAYVNASLGSWLSGNVYTTAYNELVNKLGTDNVKANTDTYTDYDFVVNQDNMTFRLPLLNGGRVLVESKYDINGGHLWYNLYSDGWCEQGGGIESMVATPTVTYPKEFINTNYTLLVTQALSQTPALGVYKQTTTSFTFTTQSGDRSAYWKAEGYTNIPTNTGTNLYYKVANAVTNLELLNASEVANAVNTVVPNNSSLISGYAMPSNRYIDLTLGASGTQYTAPANGYFCLNKINSTPEQRFVDVHSPNTGCGMRSVAPYSSNETVAFAPCKKGNKVVVYYDCAGATNWFRFVYAEGEV